MSNQKVALVTGASSGIGFLAAEELKNKGFIVYGAARRMDKLKALEEKGIKIIKLDVSDETSMTECIKTIIEQDGGVDILVNNAGYGSYGAVEDVPMEEAKKQFEVNIFGIARLIQLVLPHMRDQHFGRIINISSMAGKVHTKFGAWYHASKFALEGFSDCLRMEVAQFGIDVVVVEPGGIKTPWGKIAADNLKKVSMNGAYEEAALKTANNMRKLYSGKGLTNPKVIADVIVKAAIKTKPRTRYLIGFMAKPAVLLKRLVSDRMFDKIMNKM